MFTISDMLMGLYPLIFILPVLHFIIFFIVKKIPKLYNLINIKNVCIISAILLIFSIYAKIISFYLLTIIGGIYIGALYKIFKRNFKQYFTEGLLTGTIFLLILIIPQLFS